MCIEELFGENSVVPLHFSVVAWGVRFDSLVARSEHGSGECVGSVAGSVVGDYPLDSGDAVSGEPRSGAMHESDGCSRFLVRERFGVGKPGVAVDGGVQVHISAAFAFGLASGDGAGVVAAASVGAPSAAVGDASDFLDVDVDLVTWASGGDPARLAVVVAVRIDEPAAVQSHERKVAGDGASADVDAVIVEFERDARC